MTGILTDDSGDLMVQNGALVIGDCTAQLCERLIISWQGEFKLYPLIGGNAKRNINGNAGVFWAGEVRGQLKSQGINVKRVSANAEGFTVEIDRDI
jgi:hypothetical protein